MNFKRKRCRRTVRCTLCTKDRWKGNSKDRWKAKETEAKKVALREMRA